MDFDFQPAVLLQMLSVTHEVVLTIHQHLFQILLFFANYALLLHLQYLKLLLDLDYYRLLAYPVDSSSNLELAVPPQFAEGNSANNFD